MTWATEITFGKFKGSTLLQAFTIDKEYFGWLYNSINSTGMATTPQSGDICDFLEDEITPSDRREMKIKET